MGYNNLLHLPINTPIYALYLRNWNLNIMDSPPEIYYGEIKTQTIKFGVGTDVIQYFYQYNTDGIATDDRRRMVVGFDFKFFDTKQEVIDYYNSAIQRSINQNLKSIEHKKKLFMRSDHPVNKYALSNSY